MKANRYTVTEPLTVPMLWAPGGRVIDRESIDKQWDSKWKRYSELKGCYVFAMRAGKGYTPVYIGMATKTFRRECFTDHKISKLWQVVAQQGKGTLVLILVCHPVRKGPANRKEIREIERYLIEQGYNKNENLLNDRDLPRSTWDVRSKLLNKIFSLE